MRIDYWSGPHVEQFHGGYRPRPRDDRLCTREEVFYRLGAALQQRPGASKGILTRRTFSVEQDCRFDAGRVAQPHDPDLAHRRQVAGQAALPIETPVADMHHLTNQPIRQ